MSCYRPKSSTGIMHVCNCAKVKPRKFYFEFLWILHLEKELACFCAPQIWYLNELLQVNLCQKLLFLHQLTHNTTKDCSLFWTCDSMNNILSYCNLLCVSWCKNKCFWKRFTCTSRILIVKLWVQSVHSEWEMSEKTHLEKY